MVFGVFALVVVCGFFDGLELGGACRLEERCWAAGARRAGCSAAGAPWS